MISQIRQDGPKIRLLITSHFLDSIEEEMEDFEELQIKTNRADLEFSTDNRTEKNKRNDIKEAVVKIAEDM